MLRRKIFRIGLIVVLQGFSMVSYAQLEKGNFIIDGSFNVKNYDIEYNAKAALPAYSYEQFKIMLLPNISYFVIDNLSLGVSMPISFSTGNSTFSNRDEIINYAIGPILRYYFPVNRWAFFPEVTYLLNREVYKGPMFNGNIGAMEDVTIKRNMASIKLGIGGAYFVSDNVAIEGVISYQKDRGEYDEIQRQDFDMSTMDFTVGLQFYLSRRTQKSE